MTGAMLIKSRLRVVIMRRLSGRRCRRRMPMSAGIAKVVIRCAGVLLGQIIDAMDHSCGIGRREQDRRRDK